MTPSRARNLQLYHSREQLRMLQPLKVLNVNSTILGYKPLAIKGELV